MFRLGYIAQSIPLDTWFRLLPVSESFAQGTVFLYTHIQSMMRLVCNNYYLRTHKMLEATVFVP